MRLLVVILVALALSGCAQPAKICGTVYDTYGLLNADDKKNPDIEYRVSVGSVIVSVLLIETIIAPIYIAGFDLFEPVGRKGKTKGSLETSKCDQ